ncbi:MAG: hypothetical protein ACFE9L_10300 [Candidatus Hodarchaeota archaeon]
MSENEYLLKICIIGSNNDLNYELNALMADHIDDKQNLLTLGVAIGTRKVEIENNAIKLILVNNVRQEFFGKLRPSYYRGVSGCVILFEKSNLESFNAVDWFYNEFRKFIPDPSISFAFVGITGESEKITTEQGFRLTMKLGLKSGLQRFQYVETTIHDRETIESIFYNLIRKVLGSRKSSEE